MQMPADAAMRARIVSRNFPPAILRQIGRRKDARGTQAGILDGKVALVTGGGGGIGRATALAMGARARESRLPITMPPLRAIR